MYQQLHSNSLLLIVFSSLFSQLLFAETVKGTESMQTYMKAQAEASAEPWTLVDELKLAATATRYPSGQEWATVQVALSIEPASQRKNETRGHVVLKVRILFLLPFMLLGGFVLCGVGEDDFAVCVQLYF